MVVVGIVYNLVDQIVDAVVKYGDFRVPRSLAAGLVY